MENQEVINYLLAHNDLKIIQRKDMFNFSLDTVLLSQFCLDKLNSAEQAMDRILQENSGKIKETKLEINEWL